MKNNIQKGLTSYILPTLILGTILKILLFLKYINSDVIFQIYLPIWIFGLIACLFGKRVFSSVFVIFAGIGILVEYFLYLGQMEYPTMGPAFANFFILIIGAVIGIILQIKRTKEEKNKHKKI